MSDPENKVASETNQQDPIVQYVLVRTDLKWSIGAVIAQACHASIAAIAESLNQTHTKQYLSALGDMRKVILKAERVEDLLQVESQLKEASIGHHLWLEKPENVASCLAVSPQPKSLVQGFFKHLKLFR